MIQHDRLQRIDRRFFSLAQTVPGVPATVSGAASRYALAKNTSDRWRLGPRTVEQARGRDDDDEEKMREGQKWDAEKMLNGAKGKERETRIWSVVDGRGTEGRR